MSERRPHAVADSPTEDYEDLYENAPCGYLSLTSDGRILKLNATLAKWMGYAVQDLIGTRFHERLNIAGRIFYETHFAPLLRMQGFFNEVALDLVTQSGEKLPVLVNAAERRDGEGRHLTTRLTIFNATDRRRYERELVAAKAAAEAAKQELQALHAVLQASLLDERETSALREQFIAVLGHDLRNPVSAIGSGMTLLKRTPLNDRAKSIVGLVESSLVRMSGLIDNVLDFARGRLGGGLTLERNADEPLEPVLRQVIAELQTTNPDRSIHVRIAIARPVDCDRRRIGQVVSNLLANALTHGSREQPVRVSAATEGDWLELFVANAGDPIPPELIPNIFQPFSRGSVRPSMQGLGLGLYISHKIATAHGGTLDVVSTAEETRFTFRMPLEDTAS